MSENISFDFRLRKKMEETLRKWVISRIILIVAMCFISSLTILSLTGRYFDFIDVLEVAFFPFGLVSIPTFSALYEKHKSKLNYANG